MNRKTFLSSLVVAPAIVPMFGHSNPVAQDGIENVPKYLKKGDTIGITCPAGFITPEEIAPAVQLMQSWGFRVEIGTTVGKKDFTYGGTDEERLNDLQRMLDDTGIKAIMCARGGYGAVRLVDRIDWHRFKEHPKWIIGFSDITVLHSHLDRNLGIASIHSKMCNSFPDDWSIADDLQKDTIESIRRALIGDQMRYTIPFNLQNRAGNATGSLTGGNLKTIESLGGSSSDIQTAGKILFVEDTGEYLYSIDRMFWNLQRSGKLSQLAGLLVGGFKVKTDDAGEEFGKDVAAIVLEKVKKYNYPVAFDFPVGHQRNNFALKRGISHSLVVSESICSLIESK